MAPIRKGDGTPLDIPGVSEVRAGDGRVFFDDAIPDSVLLPETGDLTNFSGDTGSFAIDNDIATPTELTDYRLKYDATTDNQSIVSTSGLDNYPAVDQPWSLWVYIPEKVDDDPTIHTGIMTDGTIKGADSYEILIEAVGRSTFALRKDGSVIQSSSPSLSEDQWVEVRGLHEANGDFEFKLYDDGGSEIASVTGSDSSHITSGSYDHSGIYLEEGRNDTGDTAWHGWVYVDSVRK